MSKMNRLTILQQSTKLLILVMAFLPMVIAKYFRLFVVLVPTMAFGVRQSFCLWYEKIAN